MGLWVIKPELKVIGGQGAWADRTAVSTQTRQTRTLRDSRRQMRQDAHKAEQMVHVKATGIFQVPMRGRIALGLRR